jgi:aminobenzoyl-glutamate transport protein
MLVFLVTGISYGLVTGSIRKDTDVIRMSTEGLSVLAFYILLIFVAAQFIAFFNWTNLGIILALNGAEIFKSLGITGLPLLLLFLLGTTVLDLFIGSASAKWAMIAPVCVPMLLLLGFSPELTQAAYRIGDSVTNVITPLNPYFLIVLAFAQKYQKQLGTGSLMALMIPYSGFFLLGWGALLTVWYLLNLPLGF